MTDKQDNLSEDFERLDDQQQTTLMSEPFVTRTQEFYYLIREWFGRDS